SLEVPIIVVVREPPTRLGLWPVVMVGPVTVRTRIRPPAKGKPDLAWVLSAGEALGDEAIRMVDRALHPADRVQRLADALATVVDHERRHQELAAAGREAAQQEAQARSESGGRRGRRASAAAEPDAFDDEDDED